ncbi:MAG: CBS domain-containing protein [Acidobacteria bacterium]|nr:CBS domain-containing protein [Acidobacteriota bacterium]
MHLNQLVQRDFENLLGSERLRTDQETEELIFMQSIEGHAHNGAGTFQKNRYVDITIDDIVRALGKDPGRIRAARQKLIDEVKEFAQATIEGEEPRRLATAKGEPFLRAPFLKSIDVNPKDVCRGLYLGGKRDNSDVRRQAEEKHKVRIGGGEHYFVNLHAMRSMGLDGEKLAHQPHAESMDEFRRMGMIVDENAYRHSNNDHVRYMYIRHRTGPGQSDDAAVMIAGLLYGRDVAIGVFLADAIDTLEKYVTEYSDQDEDIAALVDSGMKDHGIDWDEVLQFAALSAIPEGKEQHVPDSSLRYLLLIDRHTRMTAIESHLRVIDKEAILPMPLGLNRIPSLDFYSYVNRRILEARTPARPAAELPVPVAPKRAPRVKDVMNPDIVTVKPNASVEDLIDLMVTKKRDFAIVLDRKGRVKGVVRSSDLLRIARF